MCLNVITEYEKPEDKGIGWKVFIFDNKKYYTPVVSYMGGDILEGNWAEDAHEYFIHIGTLSEPEDISKAKYHTGFHLFTKESDAKDYRDFLRFGCPHLVVKKVEWAHKCAKGFIDGAEVVVTRFIKILEDDTKGQT